MTNNFFTICSLFYSLMLTIIYFKRKTIKSVETKIYSKMIIINLINVIVAIICAVTILNKDTIPIVNDIVSKSLLLLFLTWELLFTIYIFAIAINDNEKVIKIFKKIRIFLIIGYIFIIAIVYFLPLYYHSENNVIYSYGPSANLSYALTTIVIISWVVIVLSNREILKSKKLIPVIVFIVLSIIVIAIQKMNPGLLLITATETFITFMMYFAIENPDIKMLNELYKNRELMEAIYEDKYNFLFEMTQEARNPIKNINSLCNEIRQSNDIKSIKENINKLSSESRQLDFSVNNVLNISSLDIQKIKIVNTKYDLIKLCDGIEVSIKDEIGKNVSFHMELPKQVPILYGDYMKLRQILFSILNNACKKTTNGSINLKLNTIEKYDVCRLIFNVSDTGPGMNLDIINEILGATGELSKEELESLDKKDCNVIVCKKIAKIMGGNLMIKSTIGEGTDVILTLDQAVYHENENENIYEKYKTEFNNYKKVLIVSQNKKLINELRTKLGNHEIVTSSLLYGGDAIDKIKAGKKYNYILVDDEMAEMSGLDTLNKLKNIHDFNIPVIIMLNVEKEKLKNHYLEDGFTDYLIKNNLNSELLRIIEKY